MKSLRFFLLGVVCLLSTRLVAEGIRFQNGTWQQIVQRARQENKVIFVDFYAVWCGPCKWLDREVFSQDAVGAYFNSNVVSFKVDAEKSEADLVRQVNIDAYPTLVFFTPEGKVLVKHVGALEGDQLLQLARDASSYEPLKKKVVAGTATRSELMTFLPMARETDAALFQARVTALVSSLTTAELKEPGAWGLFTQAVTRIQQKEFAVALEAAGELSQVHSDYIEYVSGRLDVAMDEVVKKEPAQKYREYLKPYIDTYERLYQLLTESHYPREYFTQVAENEYHRKKGQVAVYAAGLIPWVEKYHATSPDQLIRYAWELISTSEELPHRNKAIEWAEKALALNRNAENAYMVSRVYAQAGEKAKAIKMAREILTFEISDSDRETVEDYIRMLEEN